MFEFSVAKKYLIPKKKQLSVSLIALMSVGVISLVVWLVLVFLSVTDGIERSWLDKLTSLNAPLRITPTDTYYSSYYYQSDSISSASNYQYKSIHEKLDAETSDPYSPDVDREMPSLWPLKDLKEDGALKDPVKSAFNILSSLKKTFPDLAFQEYEISGALMRLRLVRPETSGFSGLGQESESFLTQASYLASFPDKNPHLPTLISPPSLADLNHLFYLTTRSNDETLFQTRIRSLLDNVEIKTLKNSFSHWRLPFSLIPDGTSLKAVAYLRGAKITHVIIPDQFEEFIHSKTQMEPAIQVGQLIKGANGYVFKTKEGGQFPDLPSTLPCFSEGTLFFQVALLQESALNATRIQDIQFHAETKLQNVVLKGVIPWDGLELIDAKARTTFDTSPPLSPPWVYQFNTELALPEDAENIAGILLAKNFQDSGVRLGDQGYLSYTATTTSSVQEQRLKVFVAGFYDPGILAVGSKCIFVPASIAHAVSTASSSFILDKTLSSGIQIWFQETSDVEKIKAQLQKEFDAAGIAPYWKITTFREYDFAKDLLQQFQSDKYLFTLLALIILIVACSNIISLLVLLVNDKKREIGILQSMGASSKSIALIFGLCGTVMGLLSSLIGTLAAIFTLHHIDQVVRLLSFLQGHDAFNAVFYGQSLPNELSAEALAFVLIATPILSFCAGLVPAIKACRLRPSTILRSE